MSKAKTNKAAKIVEKIISGMSPNEVSRIRRELEREAKEEEVKRKASNDAQSITYWFDNKQYDISKEQERVVYNSGNWEVYNWDGGGQAKQIQEEVQDVSFE